MKFGARKRVSGERVSRQLWRWGRVALILCPGLESGCGGSNEPGAATAAAVSPEARVEESSPAPAAQSESSPPADQCAEGTCTHCGEAVCLSGFYCDESAQACGWVPACAKEPSCECLQQALPGCSCEARQDGLFVRCG
jgi:hypothetical protein